MASYPHVLIIGAGLGGLALAQVLRKNSIPFSIFERDTHATARSQGWAIALHGPVLRDLRESLPEDLGPIEQTNHLTPLDDRLVAQFVFYDVNKPGMRVGVNDDETGKIVRANRQRLRDHLGTNIHVVYGKAAVRVEEVGENVRVHFQDGSFAEGDILVGAEGSRSVVRRHLLHGEDIMKPLPIGSIVGEVELTGDDFAHQLELAHSAYTVMTGAQDQGALFCALNKVSSDGKTGYWYFIFHFIDAEAGRSTPEKPYWTVTASQEELATFVKKRCREIPDHLRVLVDRVPVERYRQPGIVLQAVELSADQLPPGRVTLIGDAAHCMTPFRGEAGVCALADATSLGRIITRVRDSQAMGRELTELMAQYRDEMLQRAAKSIKASNPVLENHARDPNQKFVTCGKEVTSLAEETIAI